MRTDLHVLRAVRRIHADLKPVTVLLSGILVRHGLPYFLCVRFLFSGRPDFALSFLGPPSRRCPCWWLLSFVYLRWFYQGRLVRVEESPELRWMVVEIDRRWEMVAIEESSELWFITCLYIDNPCVDALFVGMGQPGGGLRWCYLAMIYDSPWNSLRWFWG